MTFGVGSLRSRSCVDRNDTEGPPLDAKVLAVQRWVNATYRAVAGYNVIVEDGVTGWQTMYALTRGLQHELGLTSLADNFGNGTLTALTAHGAVGAGETNRNIVSIAQGGATCKGYDPGDLDGLWGSQTAGAVARLMTDAGLASRIDGTIQPKVFKALLSMDGYTLVAGGDANVRAAQQWLNNRYLARSAFSVLPCDGVSSRTLQTALIFGVQYEVGLTDTQANGTFGPLTQAGVKASGLIRTGSTGAWVNLFSAALTSYPSGSGFSATFDAGLAGRARAFQAFAQLTQNGEGDFATWAGLLVSTGDPTRTATAADTIDEVTSARARTLLAGGYTLIGRYLTNVEGSGFDKKIKPGELATMFAAGLRLFPIFQTYGDHAAYFTFAQGQADAREADAAARGHNLDPGATIYFAVDFDATDANVDAGVLPYFLGVASALRALGNRYAHGVYGARNVCSRLAREAYTLRSFVSGITSGWTGNMACPLPADWTLDQIATVDLGSGDGAVEIDRCVLRAATDLGEGAVGTPAASLDEFLTWIDRLVQLAGEYGAADPDRVVLQYLRAGRYDTWQARQFGGETDAGFLAYAATRAPARIRYYRDQATGTDLDTSRLGDAILGSLTGGDFAGWGSDWVALHGAGLTSRFATTDADSPLGLAAFAVDVDAWHAATALRAGTRLATHLRAHDRASRFAAFLTGRFGGSATAAAAAAAAMLTSTTDPVVTAARERLLRGLPATAEPVATASQLFADRLTALAAGVTR